MVKKIDRLELKKIQKKVGMALRRTSKYLEDVGKDAKVFVRRGENEVLKVSKMGKAQLDILALNLKREQLYRQVGMKVWQLSTKGRLTTDKLKSFCKELAEINKRVKGKRRVISKALKSKK